MKRTLILCTALILGLSSCKENESHASHNAHSSETAVLAGQEAVQDDDSNPDIVKLAVATPDLSTLVTAVQASGLATSLSNAGPFTVFAPTNEAFGKLPKEALERLLKEENKSELGDILGHHTYVGVLKLDQLSDGQKLGMVDGKSVLVTFQDGVPTIDGAKILGSVSASNGIVHLVDTVLLPK